MGKLVDQVAAVRQITELEVQEQQGHQDKVLMVVILLVIKQEQAGVVQGQ